MGRAGGRGPGRGRSRGSLFLRHRQLPGRDRCRVPQGDRPRPRHRRRYRPVALAHPRRHRRAGRRRQCRLGLPPGDGQARARRGRGRTAAAARRRCPRDPARPRRTGHPARGERRRPVQLADRAACRRPVRRARPLRRGGRTEGRSGRRPAVCPDLQSCGNPPGTADLQGCAERRGDALRARKGIGAGGLLRRPAGNRCRRCVERGAVLGLGRCRLPGGHRFGTAAGTRARGGGVRLRGAAVRRGSGPRQTRGPGPSGRRFAARTCPRLRRLRGRGCRSSGRSPSTPGSRAAPTGSGSRTSRPRSAPATFPAGSTLSCRDRARA